MGSKSLCGSYPQIFRFPKEMVGSVTLAKFRGNTRRCDNFYYVEVRCLFWAPKASSFLMDTASLLSPFNAHHRKHLMMCCVMH